MHRCGILLLLAAALAAQQSPVFDVVSIHPVPANAPVVMRTPEFSPIQPGGYEDSRASLFSMIAFAHGVTNPSQQLEGLPGWAQTQSYSVAARSAGNSQTLSPAENRERVQAMMRAMLADRFRLRLHTETRQEPIFNLAVAGRGIRLTEVPAPAGDEKEGRLDAAWSDSRIRMIARKITMASFARTLQLLLKRPVADQTGLKGYYDIDVQWLSPEADASRSTFGETGMSLLISNLQDQFGLRLISARAPVAFWVVDSVERPSEN